MAVLSTVWFALLALLGLSVRQDAPPTEVTTGSSCRGLEVTDGSASCFRDKSRLICEVFCDGQRQGGFSCTEGEGWTPELLTCAKPIGGKDGADAEVLVAETSDCRHCVHRCKREGYSGGRCIRGRCICYHY